MSIIEQSYDSICKIRDSTYSEINRIVEKNKDGINLIYIMMSNITNSILNFDRNVWGDYSVIINDNMRTGDIKILKQLF